MRRFKQSMENEEDTGVDLTPMLDVVFIMLIFFIVTSSFVKESGIDVNRPSAKSAVAVKNGNILVGLSPSGDIFIDKRQVDLRAVGANIKRLRAEMPKSAVVVQADSDAKSGQLIELIDSIKLAGVENVSVASKK